MVGQFSMELVVFLNGMSVYERDLEVRMKGLVADIRESNARDLSEDFELK